MFWTFVIFDRLGPIRVDNLLHLFAIYIFYRIYICLIIFFNVVSGRFALFANYCTVLFHIL